LMHFLHVQVADIQVWLLCMLSMQL
jgi:hypothetical protein